jgi:hypothetical protein
MASWMMGGGFVSIVLVVAAVALIDLIGGSPPSSQSKDWSSQS